MTTAALVTMGLVAARIGGVFMMMPAFGARGVPKMSRILCVIAITAVVGPTVQEAPAATTTAFLLFGIATEVMVGVIIGGVVSFLFGALSLANELMSNQIGHGAAQLFDPMLKVSHGPLATLGSLLAAAIFLGTNMHLVLLINVADSFQAVPPGSVLNPLGAGIYWISTAAVVMETGCRLAGPVLALIFVIHTFVAVLTKLAPQMNIFFSLGLVLTVIAGCWMLMLMLPQQFEAHHALVASGIERVPEYFSYMDLAQ